MDDKAKAWFPVVVVMWVVASIVGCLCSYAAGKREGAIEVRHEAVQQGHALYVMDKFGEVNFLWETNPCVQRKGQASESPKE